jgi:UV DNA damage endonuclease
MQLPAIDNIRGGLVRGLIAPVAKPPLAQRSLLGRTARTVTRVNASAPRRGFGLYSDKMQGPVSPESAFINRAISHSDDAEDNCTAVEDINDYLPDVKGEAVQAAARRPPPVNSDFLPLPWKGRLGYVSSSSSFDPRLGERMLTGGQACLNTYLRTANPPVFCSRTSRIASILENRYPLKDPSQPAHPTKNRPDRNKRAEVALGQRYVECLGLANARDIVKMIRWNHRYGINFMRLSSEMFPFASHPEYGYKLAPFASEVLAEAGKVAAELNHRLTVHPGQV